MRRRIIAAAWILGATLPLLVASVFLAGCCVLPFHGVMHKVMPLCKLATEAIRGESADHQHGRGASTPAREKEQPSQRLVSETAPSFRLDASTKVSRPVTPTAATAYRSFISLGAVRCDRDIGLHLVDSTLLI